MASSSHGGLQLIKFDIKHSHLIYMFCYPAVAGYHAVYLFIHFFIYIHYLLRINTFSLTTILPCDPQYILKQHLHSIHINTQKFNTISKIMIANPTDHSLSNQRRAHGRIGVASQAPHTEFRQACGGYSCPKNMHLYPNLRGRIKAGSRCGP